MGSRDRLLYSISIFTGVNFRHVVSVNWDDIPVHGVAVKIKRGQIKHLVQYVGHRKCWKIPDMYSPCKHSSWILPSVVGFFLSCPSVPIAANREKDVESQMGEETERI